MIFLGLYWEKQLGMVLWVLVLGLVGTGAEGNKWITPIPFFIANTTMTYVFI